MLLRIRPFIVIIVLTGLMINLNSCCPKKDCYNAFDFNEIQLNGFSLEETKHILISSYVKGSNYNNFIDSASTSARKESGNTWGDLIIYSPVDLNQESDYLIEFTDIGQTYRISNIQTDSEKCGSCFPGSNYYIVLSGYTVNGTERHKHFFEIIK